MTDNTTIRDILAEYSMTQTELADKYGIPLRTVQGWAIGERKPAPWVITLLIAAVNSEKDEH